MVCPPAGAVTARLESIWTAPNGMLEFTVRYDNTSNVPEVIWTPDIPVHDNVASEREVLEYGVGPDHQLLPAMGTVRADYGYSPGNGAVALKNGWPVTKWSLFSTSEAVNYPCPDAVVTPGSVPEPRS